MDKDRFIGKRLDGRYEIRELIGVGGMAYVYKAYDNIDNRIVAIKILKEEFSSNEEFLRRFKNESKAIAMLSHPNIVKVYDVSFGDLLQYIVMEYIDGITLKEFIARQGALRWKDAVHFVIQILRALQHAHDNGIVHRDVKPQNIMLLPDGVIKVTDFGIARFARSEHRTITDKAIGSVHYISPEQARGESTDEKSDIYSVGIILYEMLTGELPFEAENAVSVAIMQLQTEPKSPREINPEIPLGLEQITEKAMRKDRMKRYQSAAEMLCDLEEFRRDPDMVFDHNYFLDSEPTRIVRTPVDTVPTAGGVENDEEDGDEAPRKVPVMPILGGIAVALVAVLVVLGVLLIPRLFGGSSDSFPCPEFVGQEYEDVRNNDEYKDLNITVEQEYSADTPEGYISDQSPKAGRSIKRSQEIVITVSTGRKKVKVPDVTGESEAVGSSVLKSSKFKIGNHIEVIDKDIEKGNIVRTDPEAGTLVDEGTKVTLYISSGPEVKYGTVPSVIGHQLEDARELIEKAGFTVTVKDVDNTAPKGTVLDQSPAGEKKNVARGSEITLTVSTGTPPTKTVKINVKFDLNIHVIAALKGKSGKVKIEFSDGTVKETGIISYNGSTDISYSTKKTGKIEGTVYVQLSEDGITEWVPYLDIIVDPDNGSTSIHSIYPLPGEESSYPEGTDDN